MGDFTKQKWINNKLVSSYAIDLFIELIRVRPVDCVEHEISKYVYARQNIILIIVVHVSQLTFILSFIVFTFEL